MPAIIYGDQECSKCGSKYFSKRATKDMKEHNLCFSCILDYYRFIFSSGARPTIGKWKDATR